MTVEVWVALAREVPAVSVGPFYAVCCCKRPVWRYSSFLVFVVSVSRCEMCLTGGFEW